MAGTKRRRLDPWPFIRWVELAKKICEHIYWRRDWVAKDRIGFLKQFTKQGVKFFVNEGLEEWREPLARKTSHKPTRSLEDYLVATDQEGPLTGLDQNGRVRVLSQLAIIRQAEEQEVRLI